MDTSALVWGDPPSPEDVLLVSEKIGRTPQGWFRVVCRTRTGEPTVLENAPLLFDGRPMPTLYWLVDPALCSAIGTLESEGGVNFIEDHLGLEHIAAVHDRYRALRDARMPTHWDGPVPSGGVGGTRIGIKCLHAHFGWYLAGGDDPVGAWVHRRLLERDPALLANYDMPLLESRDEYE